MKALHHAIDLDCNFADLGRVRRWQKRVIAQALKHMLNDKLYVFMKVPPLVTTEWLQR